MKRQSGLVLVVSVDLKKKHQFINPAILQEEFQDDNL